MKLIEKKLIETEYYIEFQFVKKYQSYQEKSIQTKSIESTASDEHHILKESLEHVYFLSNQWENLFSF